MPLQFLHKKNRRKINIESKYFVLDIETKLDSNEKRGARPDNFCLGVIYGLDYKKIYLDRKEMVNDLLNNFKNKYIFCHFAEFDFNILFDNIYKLDREAIFNGKFIFAQKNDTYFVDSLNIFPTSVKNIGEQIGLKKLDMPKKFLTGKVKEITKKDITYCTRDCEIIFKALSNIFNIVGNIKITLASLSMEYFRNTFLQNSIAYDEIYCNYFFNSYFGGRNEAYKLGKVKGHILDINSMYPFAMVTTKFPDPANLILNKNISVSEFMKLIRFEGMAKIEIIHNKTTYGFLPYKSNGKLLFPAGKYSGEWNLNEIRFALKNNAIQILKVDYILYSEKSIQSPFKNFINNLFQKRIESTGINNYIYKILMNSLYGKFAQKDKGKTHYYDKIPVKLMNMYKLQGVKFTIQIFSEKRNDCFITIQDKNETKKYTTIPLFASYITSFSRILLLKYLLKYDKFIPLYCDTDSIMLEKIPENFTDSKILGEFKREKGIVTEIRGLKNYSLITDNITSDKIKGVPKKAEKIGTNTFTYETIVKTKSGLIRGIPSGTIIQTVKTNSGKYDKRIVKENGETEILQINN